jgi:hypothetical protein
MDLLMGGQEMGGQEMAGRYTQGHQKSITQPPFHESQTEEQIFNDQSRSQSGPTRPSLSN